MSNITISNGIINHPRVTRQAASTGINMRVERNLTANDRIVTHHTVSGNMPTIENINNWWRPRGWNRAGYHFIIRNDGSIWQLVPIHAPAWGAGAQANPRSIHIALAGNFTANNLPSAAARTSFGWLVNQLLNSSALPNLRQDSHVTRHSDWMATACSGFTTAQFRQWIANARQTTTNPPKNNGDTFVVTRATGGFSTAGDAANNRNQRTTVQPGTYHVFNRSQGMINVTRTRGVPGSWINPVGQGANNNIRVGSRVRVNSNARTWATGQNIPAWAIGQTYTVQQLRSNNNELLLSGVLSWIRRSDVTLI